MRGKSLALLILALGCGLVASLGITQVLAKRGDSAPPADTTPVIVAKAEIAQGMLATDELVKVEQWPKDHVPAGALTRQEECEGRRARFKIFAGQPIVDPMLLHAGEVPLDAQIPNGMRVVPVPVSPEAIHSGLVVPGSRCDVQVFVRADPSLGITEAMSKTILQDIRVFAVNDITSNQTGDPKSQEQHSMPVGKTVSLLVTPSQADIVTMASQMGTIRLVLRSAEDNVHTKDRSLSARDLLGGNVGANRDLENKQAQDFAKWVGVMTAALKPKAPASAPAAAPEAAPRKIDGPPKYTMRVRSGSEVSDVEMVASARPANASGDDVTWTLMNLPTQGKSEPESHPAKAEPAPAASSAVGPAPKPQGDLPQLPPKANAKPVMGT